MIWDKVKLWAPTAAIVLGLLLLLVITMGKGVNLDAIFKRIEKTREEEKTAIKTAETARADKVQKIEEEHKATLDKLNAEQRAQAEVLRKDPKKLSKYLARVGAKLCFVGLFCFAEQAQADEAGVECAPGFPTRCSVELEANATAPFSGQLLTPDLAIVLAQTADGCATVTAAEVARVKALAAADKERDAAVHAAERTGDQRLIDVQRDVKNAEATSSTIREALGVAVIIALTIALVVK